MSKGLLIRDGRIRDGPRVVKLWQEMMQYHIDISTADYEMSEEAPRAWLQFYTKHVRSKNQKAIIAQKNGKIIGFLLGSVRKRPRPLKTRRQGFISDLAVTAKERKRGVGTRLVGAFVRWANEKGMGYIALSVDSQNRMGREFWKKMGFRTIMLQQRRML